MRVDAATGLVYRTVVHTLYTYERPTGDLMVTGYVRVPVPSDDGRAARGSSTVYAHRLIWTVCIGDIPDGAQINHINGIKHDNRLANLEVVSPSGNLTHAYDTGLKGSAFLTYNAVTQEQVARTHELLATGLSQSAIAVEVGVSDATVSRIKTGTHFSGRVRSRL